MSPVIVHAIAQTDMPVVRSCWDDDGLTVSCEVEYIPAHPPEEPTLSEKLDQQFNIATPSYILTGGTFSMILDSQKRIKNWDMFTNPARWNRGARPFIEAIPATLHIDTAFDENGRGADMGEQEVFYEPQRGTLYISWGDATNWYSIGPSLALGVTSESHFVQIRLDGLVVPEPEHKNPGFWESLRKRFGFGST